VGLELGDAWVMSGKVHCWWCTRDDMSREVHIMILSCGDMSKEVRMFRAHTWEMLRAGRFVAGGSRVLDYGWGGS